MATGCSNKIVVAVIQAGKRQRKPPPHPQTCSCSFLEEMEEYLKRYLDELVERMTRMS